ncbi:hypothetical protein Misp01_35910 [Microtetraspora sp. NBRC 13810]|uniref:hypothetical protein n=1 Tax=Microtetraspora sp. NBRC 13810 TaxID=3030990 RepID=UPI0024A548A6|nr:hypothetical protein [Microtetraspora sp. NBRC 13810]GLW08461.1 hypothetical protein Misp01_35910 [Microtetraspora sp. NBRC 13810]
MRPPRLTRRVLLRGGVLGLAAVPLAGCVETEAAPPPPKPPDPEVELLKELVAEKERTIALYREAVAGDAGLRPFQQRHEVHLAELRRRLPPVARMAASTGAPTGTPAVSPGVTATPSPPARVTVRELRKAESRAAASRVEQLGKVSPPLAQLLASIGACEAAHAHALSEPS